MPSETPALRRQLTPDFYGVHTYNTYSQAEAPRRTAKLKLWEPI